MNQRRCSEMQEVRKAIKEEFPLFQHFSLIDEEHPAFFELLRAKIESLPLRGYFAKKVRDYLAEVNKSSPSTDLDSLFPGKLPFIIESVITIQYYHNQILDGKGGVSDLDSIRHNLILGNLLKDQLYHYINSVCSEHQAAIITTYVRKIFQYTDLGQYVEKKYNTYQKYLDGMLNNFPFEREMEKFINLEAIHFLIGQTKRRIERDAKFPFLELYYKRIYLVSSTLFRLTVEMISKLGGWAAKDKEKSLIQFAEYYGLMMQLVNDNCDWVPEEYGHKTVAKKTHDAFSDLKNRNVTYPLFLYLASDERDTSIREFLEGDADYIPEILQKEFFVKMIESGIMKMAIDLGKKVGKEGLKYLDVHNSHWEFFEDMVKISQFNRYYYHIMKTEKKVRIKSF